MKSFIIYSLCLLIISIATSSAFTPSIQGSRRALIGSKSKRKPITTLSAGDAAEAPKKKKKATKKKAVKKKAKVAEPVAEESNEEEVVTFRKPEFVSKIAEKTGMSKADSEAALSAVLETITEEVAAGKRISMLGFGTFKLTHRKARKGRNPKTGEPIDIAASKSPSFTAGKAFKERCNP